jgi:predicted Zn-dependent peptidase
MYHSGCQKTELENGLKIISETIEYARSICVGIWVNAGSRDEKKEENGISHFIEHMSFKGTKNRTAVQIAKELDAIGGMSNAFTGKENTCFHARVLGKHFSVAADVLSDIFLNSVYLPEDIEKERWIILQEIKMQEDSPEEYIHDLFQRVFWKDHPIGMPILGTKDSVMNIDREKILNYIKTHYSPKNVIISAAGAVKHDDVLKYFSPMFEQIPTSDTDPKRFPPDPYFDVSVNYRDLEQVHICLGTESVSIKDERRFAVSVLNSILGGNMSSRLFQEIRERQGLAYSVYSFMGSYSDTGFLGIYVACDAAHVNNVLSTINKEIKKLFYGNLDQGDVDSAKEYLIGGIYLASESVENRMIRMAKNELIFGRYIPYEETVSCIEKVSLDDVIDAAEMLFKDKRLALVTLGPVKENELDLSLLSF